MSRQFFFAYLTWNGRENKWKFAFVTFDAMRWQHSITEKDEHAKWSLTNFWLFHKKIFLKKIFEFWNQKKNFCVQRIFIWFQRYETFNLKIISLMNFLFSCSFLLSSHFQKCFLGVIVIWVGDFNFFAELNSANGTSNEKLFWNQNNQWIFFNLLQSFCKHTSPINAAFVRSVLC